MRKKIIKIYASSIGAGFLYYLWGTLTGLWIPCMTKLTTGLDCPGCGISRMFLAILRFDFKSAFFYNPVMFVALIVWNVIAVLMFAEKVKFVNHPLFMQIMLYTTLAAMLIFGVVRNIPLILSLVS